MRHVLILAGGLSHERDVSLRSGRRVADLLRRSDVDVQVHDLDVDLLGSITQTRPEVVWPLLHGAAGEDGAIRDVLETLQIPYVGSSPQACRLTWDKPVAKALLARAGVATPASVALSHDTFRELGAAAVLDAVAARLALPLVVKPARGGSALGLSVVRARDELPTAMVNAYAYGDIALIEHCVQGVEIAVSVVADANGAPRALPAVEIVPDGGLYSYGARYTAGETEFFTPARLSASATAAATQAALTAYRTLGHRHLSRIDLIVDDHDVPWFLEANVAPGMTETSLLPMAVEAGDEPVDALYLRLIDRALTTV
jgi:D-alanine-D-alanine ligase